MENPKRAIIGHLALADKGRIAVYDDETNIITINRKSPLWRWMPRTILRHELRHMLWHAKHGAHRSPLDWIRCEWFATFG